MKLEVLEVGIAGLETGPEIGSGEDQHGAFGLR